MSYRSIVILLLAAVLAMGVTLAFRYSDLEKEEPVDEVWRAKRVVLFTVDTLRAERLGMYGYEYEETSPHIDAWARDAIVFDRATAAAPWTVPSLASLFTGRYSSEMGVYTNQTGIPPGWATLPQAFQEAGYATAAFNSHAVLLQDEIGFRRGFDSVFPESADIVLEGEHKIAFAAAEPDLMQWIDEHAEEPFFIWVHDMDPHSPPTPGNSYLELDQWHPYDAEVRWVDDTFGRLVAHLQARGIWDDDFLFVFTADHGEAFGEHSIRGHQNVMYDEVLRVPLAIYASAIKEPRHIREPVDLLDVGSTILDLAGLPQPEGTHGESLAPILMGEQTRRQREVSVHTRYYFEDGHHEYAVRDRLWKLIVKTPPSDDRLDRGFPTWNVDGEDTRYELYNMSIDPLEVKNVASRYPEVVARLRDALERWNVGIEEPDDEAPRLDEDYIETLRKLGYNPDTEAQSDE